MSRTTRISVQALAAFTILATPGTAAAQDPTVLHACYVPGTGTTYRIKAPGAPAACVTPSHKAFSWTDGADALTALAALKAELAQNPGGGPAAPTAHSALTGLDQDDHTQYLRMGTRVGNGFSVAGTYDLTAPMPMAADHAGPRLLWWASRSAFRVGNRHDQEGAGVIGNGSTAIGNFSLATNTGAMALGNRASATGHESFALGNDLQSSGSRSVAIGGNSTARGSGSITLGSQASTTPSASGAIAIGSGAIGAGLNSVAIGEDASAAGQRAIAMGWRAKADADRSVAIGNLSQTTSNTVGAVAIGSSALAAHTGAMVLSSSLGGTFQSTAENQLSARFAGGIRLRTSSSEATGCNLPANSGVWQCTSSRDEKQDFADLDGEDVLTRLRTMPVQSWSYIGEASVRHVGPTAQDFHAAFGLGTDSLSIGMLDEAGIALVAIKALEERTTALAAENAELRAIVNDLVARVAALEQRAR